MAGVPWDASYLDGPAPWDVGRPQPAITRLGVLAGPVLDAGCGTGENALHIAATGVPVLGVDVAETAVAIAQQKAAERGIDAEFETADALELGRLDRVFETVLDCGLFHTFDGEERRAYVAGLTSVTNPGGHLFILCFSDTGPGRLGPHPVSEHALRSAFETGWRVESLVSERIETRFDAQGVPAWLATIERL
jgi:2-polyprenyl-3-methyl-5-hydroxy-6-metoxy-1,4-benzoquinol methylase